MLLILDLLLSSFSCSTSCKEEPQLSEAEIRKDALTWADNIDNLFNSRYGRTLFKTFLSREFAQENLDFILKVSMDVKYAL